MYSCPASTVSADEDEDACEEFERFIGDFFVGDEGSVGGEIEEAQPVRESVA